MRCLPRGRRQRGLTLMEVLLVLVILVVLASLVALSLNAARRQAYVNAAKTQIGLFETPLQMFQLSIHSYPTTAQGLEALRTAPGDLPNPANWNGPYLEKPVPLDPWGNPYQYAFPGTQNQDSYDIWSYGPDGIGGSEDDIGNWSLNE